MKNQISIIATVAILFAWGCATVKEGERPLVVRAEQTARILTSTLDAIFELDYRHAELVDRHPALKQTINGMRVQGPGVIKSLRDSTKEFKSMPAPDLESKLAFSLSMALRLLENANEANAQLLEVTP